jgi:Flp pilus assembly pilin Flp
MTEYALILAAVAIVAYVTYQVMGQDIGSMVSTIDNALAAAWTDAAVWKQGGGSRRKVTTTEKPAKAGERRSKENNMERINKWYIRVRENAIKHNSGQTMTEYALILAAVAIVAYVTYQVMGQDIGSMVSKIDTALAAA